MEQWKQSDVVSFLRVAEPWGGFSNMAHSPLRVGRATARTVEHLYQALKLDREGCQRDVLACPSPVTAKRVAYAHSPRPDWDIIRVSVMRWCIALKARDHAWFRKLLQETEDRPIVEISWRDDFWGAQPEGEFFVGQNMLGKLLMQQRDNPLPPTPPPHDLVLLGEKL